MSELIVIRHERVLQLTLNRPAARNALNNALLTQLAEQLEVAAADSEISACVIYGSERCFAAGAKCSETPRLQPNGAEGQQAACWYPQREKHHV